MSLALLALGDVERHLGWALLLLGAGFLWLVVAVRRLEAARFPVAAGVLLIALAARLPLLALPPTLSDDALRYLWDGRVAAAGENPYRLAPDAAELEPLRDGLWRRLPHRQVPTVYPPLAVGLFSIAARLPASLPALKTLLTGADLAVVALLLALARRRGLPAARVAWYAWNPLALLETAGMGHVDALGVAAVMAALLLLDRRRPAAGAAGAAAAGGVLAKLVPLVALPMWSRQSRRPALFLTAALGLTGLALLPVVTATGGVPPGLIVYGVSWEFNGPVYEPLWRLLAASHADAAVAAGLDHLKAWTGLHDTINPLYPYVYPQLLAKLLLAAGIAAAVARSLGERDPLAGSRRLFGALLLLSATVYPWYALWVLALAALRREASWLALSALLPLTYLPQLRDGVELWPWVWLAVWGPFAVLHWLPRIRRRMAAPADGPAP